MLNIVRNVKDEIVAHLVDGTVIRFKVCYVRGKKVGVGVEAPKEVRLERVDAKPDSIATPRPPE